jgi:hypothetical protein
MPPFSRRKPNIRRRRSISAGFDDKADSLIDVQRIEAGPFQLANVDEKILATIVATDESEAAIVVEKLDLANA